MKNAKQWLDEMQEDQTAACVHYEIHKQMGPSVSMLDWIEMIQHDVQDNFAAQVDELKAEKAMLKALVDAGMHESADLHNKIAELKAENARLAAELALSLNANRPLALSREELGKKVREVWIRWAQSQPNPKTHWLLPWSALAESDREVDRMIGEEIARWSLVADASLRAAREGGK